MALPIATDLRFLLLGKGHNRLRLFEGKGEYHQYSKLAIDDTTNKKGSTLEKEGTKYTIWSEKEKKMKREREKERKRERELFIIVM